jgi:hypothetical protein
MKNDQCLVRYGSRLCEKLASNGITVKFYSRFYEIKYGMLNCKALMNGTLRTRSGDKFGDPFIVIDYFKH